MQISSSLYQASASLAQIMIQSDSSSLHLEVPELEGHQQADIEMAGDKGPYSRPLLPAEGEIRDTEKIEQVFWGEARAPRLPDREGSISHRISKHLISPRVSLIRPGRVSRRFN